MIQGYETTNKQLKRWWQTAAGRDGGDETRFEYARYRGGTRELVKRGNIQKRTIISDIVTKPHSAFAEVKLI